MILIGFVLGLAVGGLALAIFVQHRAHWLAQYQFILTQPPVPNSILADIRTAEAGSYRDLPVWRQWIEHAQDALALALPQVVYRANLSVGRYRMKAHTLEDVLGWATGQGYLRVEGDTANLPRHAISYFAEQPILSRWEAAVYLAWLRQSHPGLAALTWAEIAGDPRHVAKLYSGYMGAGGAMDAWRDTMEPGAVALRRLGITD